MTERNARWRRLHEDGLTAAEIGRREGVTRERVRQIVGPMIRKSLVGERYGRLVVTSEDPERTQDSWISCACDCGKTKIMTRKAFIDRNARSCDCLARETARESGLRNRIDLVGMKFGRLTVLRQWWEKSGSQNIGFAECACDCGERSPRVRTAGLRKGKTRSCGCLARERWDRSKEAG